MSDDGLLSAEPGGWPAAVEGVLRVPGDEYILDSLTRSRVLASDDRFMFLPEYCSHLDGPTVVAVIGELPDCDLCQAQGNKVNQARYDGKLAADSRGFWAYMCPFCFVEQGPKRLGGGIGQYLVAEHEIPQRIWEALATAEEIWRARL